MNARDLCLSLLLLAAHPLTTHAASVAAPPHPPLTAAPASGIRCDGVLDEPAWSAAVPATDLYQQTPDQGAPATMKSEFRVLFDDGAIYVGARLYDASP